MSYLAAARGMGQAWAETRMTDSCVISWQSGEGVLNEDTSELETQRTTLPAVKCELQMPARDPREGEQGGYEYAQGNGTLKLPASFRTPIPTGAVAEIVASETGMTGTVVRIGLEQGKTHATARRFAVEVTTWQEE